MIKVVYGSDDDSLTFCLQAMGDADVPRPVKMLVRETLIYGRLYSNGDKGKQTASMYHMQLRLKQYIGFYE